MTLYSDASAETRGDNLAQSHALSWVNRLTQRARTLPVPVWLFYLSLWLLLAALQTAVKWRDGAYPVGELYLPHVVLAGLAICLLAAIHFLDDVASRALVTFRPLLDVDDEQTKQIRSQLTTMPARRVRLLTAAASVFYVPIAVEAARTPALLQALKMYTSPLAVAVDTMLNFAAWLLWLLFIYHTTRQLRLVSRLYTKHTHVNLFQPGPLYALSRLTVASALAIILIGYIFYAAFPVQAVGRIESPTTWTANTWGLIGTMLVALAAFILPLLGVHGLMVKEKERLLAEASRRLEATIAELHRRADANELQGMDMLSDLLASLIAEQQLLSEISTWPWHSATVQLLVSAGFLPLLIYFIQQTLMTLLGP